MVWYGMVWYGMVWYGMVWYGMVWYEGLYHTIRRRLHGRRRLIHWRPGTHVDSAMADLARDDESNSNHMYWHQKYKIKTLIIR
jgi:hypothetical protein